jgi:nucleotide-binding universal stress UspA family protein
MDQARLARVLGATNGSEAGQHAARFARELARKIGAKIRILSVETGGIPGFENEEGPIPRRTESSDVAWSRGIPGIEIVRAAEQWKADLVVIGRRARPGGDEHALGSTVEAVVRRWTGPCLLVPPHVDTLERMLIALDGTRRGLGILPAAERLARSAALQVRAVYAPPGGPPFLTGEGQLRQALAEYPGFGSDILSIRPGPPVQEILLEASARKADVLVVGVRRGGPPGEAGSGHIGRDLLKEAPLAILTVPI